MVANRQDAWTPDDDLLLAEVTLRHIREGSTQLRAFEEVAERLGRTSAACGFRWNSAVRKNYEDAIAIAKTQRKKNKLNKNMAAKSIESSLTSRYEGEQIEESIAVDFEAVINFLKRQRNENQQLLKQNRLLESELEKKESELEQLRRENDQMKNECRSAKSVNDDYLALVKIMERARKLAFLNHEEEKPIFKMDANGNLERVNK